ncbi:transcription factor SPT20 homolog [Lutzomyia longipalpis]|uniref:transcription factor SPT20 homolog n=1 Tax=Lutzomyia longipalpis TaxID=7200 RepID=UPI002483B813|nr:transcription factor SPT20 homolog [Lutzomyia longipalpis]
MRLRNLGILLFTLLAVCEARRVRVQTRPKPEDVESREAASIEHTDADDSKAQPAIQYYSAAEPQDNQGRVILVASDDDYNGPYGQPTLRPRADYNRPTVATRPQTAAPIARSKDHATKPPPVQTIRNYSKVNDDGSFTFGYEAADGSFKEETRGTDCVVRGKYGYIDPDGNKREFTYVSGNPCDPNNPESEEEEQERSEEDSNENIPQNYPRRPVPRPVRPLHTTPRPTTTVFQNNYAHASLPQQQDGTDSEESEEQEPIQYIQPQRPSVTQRPIIRTQPQEVTIRERPRVTVSTTPTPAAIQYTPSQSVSITPRPTYRAPTQTLQTQPPATTYRPALSSTQKSTTTYNSPSAFNEGLPTRPTASRRPIDFAAEFQKFQDETNALTPSPVAPSAGKPFKPAAALPTGNPIYQSQLIFDPSTGQYDANLYQQLPQSEGDFALSHRIQPYVHLHPQPTLVSLEQLQNQSPLYRQQIPQPQPQPQQLRPAPIPVPQFSQQVYQKSQENLQVLNSQQLFAQQQELAQQQLQHDRLHAAKKSQSAAGSHRFQVQAQPQRAQPQALPPQQAFYLIQPAPGGSLGQIDAFLRGQNLDY